MVTVVDNPDVKRSGIKFHPSQVVSASDKAISFHRYNGSAGSNLLWLPKSQIHLEKNKDGNYILWVKKWLVRKGEVDKLHTRDRGVVEPDYYSSLV